MSLQTVGLYNYLKQQTAPCEYRLIEEEVSVIVWRISEYPNIRHTMVSVVILSSSSRKPFQLRTADLYTVWKRGDCFLLRKVGDLDSHLSLAETGLCWNSEELAGTLENIRRLWIIMLGNRSRSIPHICHLFYTDRIFKYQILQKKNV